MGLYAQRRYAVLGIGSCRDMRSTADLVFDLDGTISDPLMGIFRSANSALESHGLRVTSEDAVAAMAAIGGHNPIADYYDILINKGISAHNARHAVARYIARISYGILKSGKEYQPYRWREEKLN